MAKIGGRIRRVTRLRCGSEERCSRYWTESEEIVCRYVR